MLRFLCSVSFLLGCFIGVNRPALAQQAANHFACPSLEPGPTRTVTAVLDGETVVLDDGAELRLIGALAPRALDVGLEAGQWVAENRTREELRTLLLGRSIELGIGGDRRDRYGHLQAQAFLVEGDRRRWVQGHLLEQGLARAYTLAGNRTCANELLAAEQKAREAGRGLWAEAAYQVRQADLVRELLSYRATFQIVEGQVVRVALVRGVIHLNFARNWRKAFSASVSNGDRAALGVFAENPKGLEGRFVRVRGWIEQRGGAPVLNLSAAGQIEILAPSAAEPNAFHRELRQPSGRDDSNARH